MAELVDALDLGSSGSNPVEVQVFFPAPNCDLSGGAIAPTTDIAGYGGAFVLVKTGSILFFSRIVVSLLVWYLSLRVCWLNGIKVSIHGKVQSKSWGW